MKLLTKVLDAEIIERGNNANGKYIKFGNGILIQYGVKQFSGVNCDILTGAVYRSIAYGFDFPLAFTTVDSCSLNISKGSHAWMGVKEITTFGVEEISFYRGLSTPGLSYSVSFLAMGTWK